MSLNPRSQRKFFLKKFATFSRSIYSFILASLYRVDTQPLRSYLLKYENECAPSFLAYLDAIFLLRPWKYCSHYCPNKKTSLIKSLTLLFCASFIDTHRRSPFWKSAKAHLYFWYQWTTFLPLLHYRVLLDQMPLKFLHPLSIKVHDPKKCLRIYKLIS